MIVAATNLDVVTSQDPEALVAPDTGAARSAMALAVERSRWPKTPWQPTPRRLQRQSQSMLGGRRKRCQPPPLCRSPRNNAKPGTGKWSSSRWKLSFRRHFRRNACRALGRCWNHYRCFRRCKPRTSECNGRGSGLGEGGGGDDWGGLEATADIEATEAAAHLVRSHCLPRRFQTERRQRTLHHRLLDQLSKTIVEASKNELMLGACPDAIDRSNDRRLAHACLTLSLSSLRIRWCQRVNRKQTPIWLWRRLRPGSKQRLFGKSTGPTHAQSHGERLEAWFLADRHADKPRRRLAAISHRRVDALGLRPKPPEPPSMCKRGIAYVRGCHQKIPQDTRTPAKRRMIGLRPRPRRARSPLRRAWQPGRWRADVPAYL